MHAVPVCSTSLFAYDAEFKHATERETVDQVSADINSIFSLAVDLELECRSVVKNLLSGHSVLLN